MRMEEKSAWSTVHTLIFSSSGQDQYAGKLSSPGGIPGGQVIYADSIHRPSPAVFADASRGRVRPFMRGLGLNGELQNEHLNLPSAGIVVERLFDL